MKWMVFLRIPYLGMNLFVHAVAYKFVKYIPFQGENARKYVGQETMGGSQRQASGHSNRERDELRSEKVLFTDSFGHIC